MMATKYRRRVKRKVFKSRDEAMMAEDNTKGRIFYVRLPSGEAGYVRAGSNSAAFYDVGRSFGGSVRVVRDESSDPSTALALLAEMSPEDRKKILEQAKKMG